MTNDLLSPVEVLLRQRLKAINLKNDPARSRQLEASFVLRPPLTSEEQKKHGKAISESLEGYLKLHGVTASGGVPFYNPTENIRDAHTLISFGIPEEQTPLAKAALELIARKADLIPSRPGPDVEQAAVCRS